MNTADELIFLKQVAESTGLILDPVYSGKAAYGMMKDMRENPRKWEGRKILFIHTGGLLGVYDKGDEIASFLGKWRKMHIDESSLDKKALVKCSEIAKEGDNTCVVIQFFK